MSHFNFEIENISEYNISEKVTSSTPPTFIWHTADDEGVPIYNSLKYCDRLSKHQVPFEAHFLNLDLMVSLWLIGQPLLLMPIVFRQCIAGFLGLLIGWKDKSKIKNTTQKWYFLLVLSNLLITNHFCF